MRYSKGSTWCSRQIGNEGVNNRVALSGFLRPEELVLYRRWAGWRTENASAIFYTVIEICRRRGIDPYAYLRDVLTRLPRMTNWQIPEVTPQAWAKPQRVLARFIAS